MRVLVLSTYELGRQPVHAATTAAALVAVGHDVRCNDLAVDALDEEAVVWADRVAVSVPMHTALRLGVDAASAIRRLRPDLPVAAFGLYAPNADPGSFAVAFPSDDGTDVVAWCGSSPPADPGPPARHLLPPLDRYARLDMGGGDLRVVAAVESTRGCSHRCRHCPVPVVYDGRAPAVEVDRVLADVAQAVALGAEHVTFADPDFLNRPLHARRVVDAIHGAFPALTFDATVKVEHVLRHRDVWPSFAAAGCLFVVSAFESVDDAVLSRLDKGHTASDMPEALSIVRGAGIDVRPSWLPFTPWTTLPSVAGIADFVADHDLAASIDPVQLSIRLLVPRGSLLAAQVDGLGPYDPSQLAHPWRHADPRIDALQAELAAAAEAGESVAEVCGRMWGAAGLEAKPIDASPAHRPRLTEAWFCCAEPTAAQSAAVGGSFPATP